MTEPRLADYLTIRDGEIQPRYPHEPIDDRPWDRYLNAVLKAKREGRIVPTMGEWELCEIKKEIGE